MREMITLSQMEMNRVIILQKALDGEVSVPYTAFILGISERHAYRLKAKLQTSGPAGLTHGNRGRKPAHALPDNIRQEVVQLAQTKYRGCNYTFLSELLREHEGICLSPASVGRILKAAGILSPRKHRPPKPHCRRPRKPQLGMLVQIDGSHHDWLEGRGPWLVLLLAIDDAAGRILSALFWPAEDFEGYCRLLYQLISQHGIPLAVYSDRHTLFFSPKEKQDRLTLEEQFLGERRSLTQIGRILRNLGIQHIPAYSPQAKGRIERSFETLQQRLVIELRLAGASSLEEANAVLPGFIERYNEKFAVPPAETVSAFRPIPSHLRLEYIFSWKEYRTLNPGYTIHFQGKTYKVLNPKGAPFIPLRSVVEVLKPLDGSLCVAWQGHIYSLEVFLDNAKSNLEINRPAMAQVKSAGSTPSLPRRPAANHPWRNPWKPRRPNYTTSLTESQMCFT
ncbi:MAG: ISNCY family transposase [Peptococcaceae bacterium]|nr:ISNCY family transposase [Peptococcaceae bacterium]